jgi:hypothetical protein
VPEMSAKVEHPEITQTREEGTVDLSAANLFPMPLSVSSA